MFAFLKRLFHENTAGEVVLKSSSEATAESESTFRIEGGRTAPAPSDVPSSFDGQKGAQFLALPLKPILDRLPTPLASRVAHPPTVSDVLPLPLSAALEQLPSGAVRLPFRDLKRRVRPGIFAPGTEMDELLVDVPLPEILSRLDPRHLARRAEQKRLVLPEEIGAVFSSQFSHGPEAAPGRVVLPHLTAAVGEVRPGTGLAHTSLADIQRLSAPTLVPHEKITLPLRPQAPIPMDPPVAREIASPTIPRSAPAPKGASAIALGLADLSGHWPEPVRQEITSLHTGCLLNIPLPELEAALKHGKAIFSWAQLRQWLTPRRNAGPAAYDDAKLELALSILIPAFLAQRPGSGPGKQPAAAADLPDVFARKENHSVPAAGSPRIEHPVAEHAGNGSRPIESPALSQNHAAKPAPQAQAVPAHVDAPWTVPRSAVSPAEIVQRACRLGGVSGALVATSDGFVVANQAPSNINGETLAAFLPQAFNRLAQYTRELKLGEPSQMELLIDKTPLEVYKGAITYFAVVGKAGEPLPKAQLSVLASQLSVRTS